MILAAGWLALASVPEAFVVLWAIGAGMSVHWVPLVWAAASLAKMAIAMPAGIVSDRLGRIPVLLGGWSLRVFVLLLLAALPAPPAWRDWPPRRRPVPNTVWTPWSSWTRTARTSPST